MSKAALVLPDVQALEAVPVDELPTIALELAALQGAVAARLHRLARHQDDDCECYDAEQVAHLLRCSVDLVRQRGEEWGITKVLARDNRGRPSRVVYPRALLRQYLNGKPR